MTLRAVSNRQMPTSHPSTVKGFLSGGTSSSLDSPLGILKLRWGLFALVLTLAILAAGCTGQGRFSTKGGWSGPAAFEFEDGKKNVYIGSQDGRVVALSIPGGNLLWSFPLERDEPLGAVLYGTSAVDEERVYVGTYDGKLYALSAKTGEEVWDQPFEVEGHIIGGPTLAGREQCFTAERSSVEGDLLLFGSTDGNVYALCTGNGKLSWRFQTLDQGEVWSSPTVDGNTVYFGSQDQRLYAVSLDTGVLLWREPFKAGGAIVASPLVVGERVLFGALDRKFYAVDTRSGTSAWSRPFQGSSWFWASAVSDGVRVYAVSADGMVYGLDPETGFKQWEGALDAMVISAPVLAELRGQSRLVVATKNGRVSVLSTDGGQEESFCEMTDAGGDSVKVKAPLGGHESTIFVNTLDPWTLQALNLEDGTCRALLE